MNVFAPTDPSNRHFSDTEKAVYDKALLDLATHAAKAVFGPRLLQIQFMPRTIDGLREADALLDETPFRLVQKEFANLEPLPELMKEMADRRSEAIALLEKEFEGFPGTKAGLRQSLSWYVGLEARVEDALDDKALSRIKDAWDVRRDAQLEEALPVFETEIMTASDADALFAEYVSLEYDGDRPVVLDFEFVRAFSE